MVLTKRLCYSALLRHILVIWFTFEHLGFFGHTLYNSMLCLANASSIIICKIQGQHELSHYKLPRYIEIVGPSKLNCVGQHLNLHHSQLGKQWLLTNGDLRKNSHSKVDKKPRWSDLYVY